MVVVVVSSVGWIELVCDVNAPGLYTFLLARQLNERTQIRERSDPIRLHRLQSDFDSTRLVVRAGQQSAIEPYTIGSNSAAINRLLAWMDG